MFLIIDGYNLLHATEIFGPRRGPGSLDRSRRALLGFLAATLSEEERARTTVVFDAGPAASRLPNQAEHQGMTVLYASHHEDADTLIEQLIRACSGPRQLTVVSSDHRLQRAARRRRARAVDSRTWYTERLRQRHAQRTAPPHSRGDSRESLTEGEVDYWLAEFGLDDAGPAEEGPPV